MINIKGMDKAEVFRRLYNHAKPQGMGFLTFRPGDLPMEDARRIVAQTTDFDYVGGRVMKVNISGDEFNESWYDRDNGRGAAARALEGLSPST